nr:type I-E CRISPR-associated protein Cse2/CasB [Streptomyces sp. RFCAC02]
MPQTAPPPTAPQRVRDTTAGLIAPLQSGYLADRSTAVAALARLRRGAGRDLAANADLWGLVDTGPLHAVPEGERRMSDAETEWAENAVHIALTLWASHQQSRSTAMHRATTPAVPTGLGRAVRRLLPADEIDGPVRKRFVRVGTATDLGALTERLRNLVDLLRRDDVPLDYGLLAEQLYRWQAPGGRDTVRRDWGRSFHTPPLTTDTGTDPTAADSEENNAQ